MRWYRTNNGYKEEIEEDTIPPTRIMNVKENETEEDKSSREEQERIERIETEQRIIYVRNTDTLDIGNRQATDCKLNKRIYLPYYC